ncbi:DUF747 family protein [Coprinopsis cinerea okayama7|uniref:DUF747 family protein n=1 Tax=Coprinopsis cinerea (strain Okayama-7 / 130 / ATCC MYA-4618 / FGSC 9003) TaxID=240176 RepID=A8N7H3_COPC7|nr:DUF747 family protein [Coprinopsis cinerea okayama7\|eukprot:XP_001830779.2 DUF747 family protein [Coprinopsis cinerea okayama7\
MTTSHSPRLNPRNKARRRFSASATGWTPSSPKPLASAPLFRPNKQRRVSMSPPTRTALAHGHRPYTDTSDYEDDHHDIREELDWLRRARSTSPKPLIFDDEPRQAAYSSLPPTPILPSHPYEPPTPVSPLSSAFGTPEPPTKVERQDIPFSLWDYLREELLATDFDSHQEQKWERVSNFLSMPLAMEKIIGFGVIVCFDSFLYTFTILPIRFFLAFLRFIGNMLRISSPPLPPSQKADLLRGLLLIISLLILNPLTDASKIYHTIRGQDTIKLYVIFNALEIADRLCASIGQDVLDCLFSRSTLEPLTHRIPVTTQTLRPIFFFFLATIYNVAHGLVMVYQLIALNVAINSYDHALLTLLVSNQFVEIKGSVFKKFEKDNLFQITCADIVERFTLSLMLLIVALRNLMELRGTDFEASEGFVLPKSFGWFRGNNILWTISYPVVMVLGCEMVVDWLKHAFITKFNHIRPSVYERYTDVLCLDLSSGSAVGRRRTRKHSYVDQSPLVARRLGFASLPLAALFILVGSQSLSGVFSSAFSEFTYPWTWSLRTLSQDDFIYYLTWATIGLLFWLCFVCIKIIVGINLISFATRRRAGMEAREAADVVNDFGRDPIGEGKEERKYNKELKSILDNDADDVPRASDIGENKPGDDRSKKRRLRLEELTRYTMVKRIW